jgi:hypothetical protein
MAEIQSVRKRKEPEHPSSTSETNIDKSNGINHLFFEIKENFVIIFEYTTILNS